MRLPARFWLFATLLCAAGSCRAADIHPSSPAVKKELTEVVERQLAAFRGNDFAQAYTFASSEIQSVYSAEAFEEMVRKAYPVIARSTSSDVGEALDDGENAKIDVHVFNVGDRREGQFTYRLHSEDGKWRITGVLEVKPTGLTV